MSFAKALDLFRRRTFFSYIFQWFIFSVLTLDRVRTGPYGAPDLRGGKGVTGHDRAEEIRA